MSGGAVTSSTPMLKVEGLVKHFAVRGNAWWRAKKQVKAVDGISFNIAAGETYALVGESGCGKSTTGRMILRLIEPTSGNVSFGGHSILGLDRAAMRAMRQKMQIVFQDPYGSLNPRLSARRILEEPLQVQGRGDAAARRARIDELFALVGLTPAHGERYPHEFSGGQRQRIAIARALAGDPELIVCDEPVSALDVSIQAQIVNLLQDLQRRLGMIYLFIAHDLAVVNHIADRVGVMYLGRLVEEAPKAEIFATPRHPYTQALLNAVPVADPRARRQRALLQGDIPNPIAPPEGCHFHTRCPFATDLCRREAPRLTDIAPHRRVACHHWRSIEPFTPAATERGSDRLRRRIEAFARAKQADA